MSVYVDNSIYPYGRMMMCHMVADSVEELHEMADKIGVNRKWFQSKSKYKHYDICKAKRALAVGFGAKEVTGKDIVLMFNPGLKKALKK